MTGEKLEAPEDRPPCEDFAERISSYHDGRWPEASSDCAAVEEHLAGCPRCAELLEDYRAITNAALVIRSIDTPEADGEITSRRVRARLRRRTFRRRLAWTGAGVAFAAAAAAAAVAIMALPGPAPSTGGGLAREEPEPTAGKLAGGPAERATALEATATVTGEAGETVPPAEAPDYDELARRVEELRRRGERRPADGVRLVGEGGPRRERAPAPPRIVRPPEPPLLGVYLKDVGGLPGDPVVGVVGVVAGSPAEGAGLRVGDIILSIDGKRVRGLGPDSVGDLIRRAGPGAKIAITYARDGATRKAEVVLAGKR